MSDKFFIDTNIFIYSFDARETEKKVRSLGLIADALQSGNGVISTQVVQEFFNVATRKFVSPIKSADAKIYLQRVMYPLCHIFPDLDLYQNALDISGDAGYSFYDSLIIAGAQRAECALLYSEDLRHGHTVNGVRIVNPFL